MIYLAAGCHRSVLPAFRLGLTVRFQLDGHMAIRTMPQTGAKTKLRRQFKTPLHGRLSRESPSTQFPAIGGGYNISINGR